MPHGLADHPFIGRRNRPYPASRSLQLRDQSLHLRKNPANEIFFEVLTRYAKHISLGKSCVQRHHPPAHVVTTDLARTVISIAGPRPANDFVRDDSAFQFPVKKSFARIP